MRLSLLRIDQFLRLTSGIASAAESAINQLEQRIKKAQNLRKEKTHLNYMVPHP